MGVATIIKQQLRTGSLSEKLSEIKKTIAWHCDLSEDEVFMKIVEAGEYYLKGRVREDDYKLFLRDKGFWHWFEQIYCKNARWLMQENNWEYYNKNMSDEHYYFYAGRKDYDAFFKYLRAKNDTYSFAPVLIAMQRGAEYDGRVFW